MKKIQFPYLYDGDSQKVSEAYGPYTPHVFVFDESRTLRIRPIRRHGKPYKTPRSQDTRNAIDELLNKKDIQVKTTKVFGCSVKWAEKRESVAKAFAKWANEPVNIESMDFAEFTRQMDSSGKLMLTIFGAWVVHLAQTHLRIRHYQPNVSRQDFEFTSINLDGEEKALVLEFLKVAQASNQNFLALGLLITFTGNSNNFKLPLTLLIEPGGNIVSERWKC
jgi:hypothetical protein